MLLPGTASDTETKTRTVEESGFLLGTAAKGAAQPLQLATQDERDGETEAHKQTQTRTVKESGFLLGAAAKGATQPLQLVDRWVQALLALRLSGIRE
jgi:hypothetical protein